MSKPWIRNALIAVTLAFGAFCASGTVAAFVTDSRQDAEIKGMKDLLQEVRDDVKTLLTR